MAIKKSDLYASLWASCDRLRGGMDASQYKDYVLFIKYISDKYAGSDDFAPPVVIPPGASFKDMVALKGIIETFRALDTERCETVATLYAAWNDLLRDKGPASDDAIVHEVLNHWHEAKQRIPEDRWRKALGWMREKGFVPQGVALP